MAKLIEDLSQRCSSCESYTMTSESTNVEYTNNRLKSCDTSQSAGTALRVIKDGRIGTAVAAGEGRESGLGDLALSVAPYGPKAEFTFSKASEVREAALYDSKEAEFSIDEMVSLGGKLLEGMQKRWPDLICGAGCSRGTYEVSIATSAGFEGSFKGSDLSSSASVQASREGDIFQWGANLNGIPTEENISQFLEKCHEWIELGLNVAHLDPGTHPVILAPNCMPFLLRALEAGVKGNNIFEKKSPLTGKTGELVLSPMVSLYDDPTWDRTSKTVPFDDEGVATSKRAIFDKGVFTGPITDLEYAAKLGVEPTGNAYRIQHIYRSRVLAGGVSIAGGNWRISGTEDGPSRDELIADVDCGVYVDCSFDCWMGNIINGQFTGTLHRAYKIEKGKLVGRLKHLSFSGNIYDALGKDFVASTSVVEQPDMGFEFIETPYILVKGMSIS